MQFPISDTALNTVGTSELFEELQAAGVPVEVVDATDNPGRTFEVTGTFTRAHEDAAVLVVAAHQGERTEAQREARETAALKTRLGLPL